MTLVVGLTGGIGSGKSTVAGIFRELGAEVLDADVLAHEVLESASVAQKVRGRFGTTERMALARVVFRDPDARRFLEGLIHPAVRERIEHAVRSSTAPVTVLDVPLLAESPLKDLCSEFIFIKVPDEMRFERVKSRGWSREEWLEREKAQTPLDKKEALATFVLDGSPPLSELKARIEGWLKKKIRIS